MSVSEPRSPVTGVPSSPPRRGKDGARRLGRPAKSNLVWSLPGFGPMTRITTSIGEVHAGALRERDLVRTRSGEFRPIVWVDRILLEEGFLERHHDAHPILIKAGALGRGLPRADVTLSPRQPIVPLANQLPGSAKTAADLLNRPGVFRKAETSFTYTLFHCGTPEIVMTEKLWVGVSP